MTTPKIHQPLPATIPPAIPVKLAKIESDLSTILTAITEDSPIWQVTHQARHSARLALQIAIAEQLKGELDGQATLEGKP